MVSLSLFLGDLSRFILLLPSDRRTRPTFTIAMLIRLHHLNRIHHSIDIGIPSRVDTPRQRIIRPNQFSPNGIPVHRRLERETYVRVGRDVREEQDFHRDCYPDMHKDDQDRHQPKVLVIRLPNEPISAKGHVKGKRQNVRQRGWETR